MRGSLNKLLEPCTLDVVLELNAQRAVVPGVCKTAVDLAACVYKAAVFAQSNDFFHCLVEIFHIFFHLSVFIRY